MLVLYPAAQNPALLAPPLPPAIGWPCRRCRYIALKMFSPNWLSFQGCSGMELLMETAGVLLLGVVFQ